MRSFLSAMVLCGGLLASANVGLAQHAGDVEVTVAGGKIVTNSRVYGVEFGENFAYYSDEPGYDALPGTFVFPGTVGFDILGSLKKWNGTDFSTPATTRILFESGPGKVLSPSTDVFTAGINLAVDASGEWHHHYGMTLVNAAGTSLPAPSPGPLDYAEIGVYLLELQLHTSQTNIANSLPYYFVYNNGDSEANHDAAIAFQVAAIPEPGTWALLTCGIGSLWAGRRLRRRV